MFKLMSVAATLIAVLVMVGLSPAHAMEDDPTPPVSTSVLAEDVDATQANRLFIPYVAKEQNDAVRAAGYYDYVDGCQDVDWFDGELPYWDESWSNSKQVSGFVSSDVVKVELVDFDEGAEVTVRVFGSTHQTLKSGSESTVIYLSDYLPYGGTAYILIQNTTGKVATVNASCDSDHDGIFDDEELATSISYATYFGGDGYDGGVNDNGTTFVDTAVDDQGNIYIAAPTTSASLISATNGYNGAQDVFVTKINADGTLAYTSYLGGTGNDGAVGIAVDDSGNVYVVGSTQSPDFPTSGGYDTNFAGGSGSFFYGDAFVAKLDTDGQLTASTYLGGSGEDVASGVALDAVGNVYVTGYASELGYTSVSGFEYNGAKDVFVAKLSNDLSALHALSYLGSNSDDGGYDIVLTDQGDVLVAGYTWHSSAFQPTYLYGTRSGLDVLVAKWDSTLSVLAYTTILAGSDADFATAIAVDSAGNAYVTGLAPDADFPVTGQAYDTTYDGSWEAFVAKLSTNGERTYATYLGGAGADIGNDIAVDDQDNVYVTGKKGSDFPFTAENIQPCENGTFTDAFLTVLDTSGSQLLYSTCLGGSMPGSGMDIASALAWRDGTIYLAGATWTDDFPGINGPQQTRGGAADVFVSILQ